MTSVSVLLILIGVFIIFNANNIKDVLNPNSSTSLTFQGADPNASVSGGTGGSGNTGTGTITKAK